MRDYEDSILFAEYQLFNNLYSGNGIEAPISNRNAEEKADVTSKHTLLGRHELLNS